ncbi:hypothetical protein [Methylocaldum sp. SAD2]|uniref:hypothetical protein n=1 Tax=Methylocaldum sp. GT1BB TaxID=3438963 RepID=UPI00143DD901
MSNVALKLLVGIVGLAAGESYAFVVDGGMEITARQTYVIGAGSSVTYTPPLGLVVSGPSSDEPSQPQTYTLTGRFDIEFYRYWWRSEISMDGGTLEDTTEQFWAQLISTELYGAESGVRSTPFFSSGHRRHLVRQFWSLFRAYAAQYLLHGLLDGPSE